MQDSNKITVVFGPNGSGKTQWVEQLRRQLASDSVRYLAFSDAYGPATDKAYYLQLRWNQHDIDPETPTVGQLLEKRKRESTAWSADGTATSAANEEWIDQLYDLFSMRQLLDKYVILLSSGELRKFQLIKTLISHPTTLILDNPYIGLDAEARNQLNTLFPMLAHQQGIRLYLLLSRSADMPSFADEIINTESFNEATNHNSQFSARPKDACKARILRSATSGDALLAKNSQLVIDMKDVNIRYGERTILRDLDWQVREGERWALLGENGSGKSTLLSLICADNPQSYACDITLFGQQRGTGESIWEIKKRIGYVSPEMHRSYLRSIPALLVVASGLKDTVGLYVRPTEAERQQCLWWMRLFDVEALADRPFTQLSSGEQRLVLVVRAFVKDPELLILDEPLHGLDDHNRFLVRQQIEAFCARRSKTLIMVTHYEEELPQCITHRLYLKRQE